MRQPARSPSARQRDAHTGSMEADGISINDEKGLRRR